MSDEPKLYSVVMHDDAKEMLYAHVRFVANVSIPAARKLRDTLYKAAESLETMPHRCALYHTRRTTDVYRRLVVGRYRIVFTVNEAGSVVETRYILDSRQDNDI